MPTLTVGDPAPWFIVPSIANQSEHLDTLIGGYRAVLFFFGSARDPQVKAILEQFLAAQEQLQQRDVTFFGIGIDLADRSVASQIRVPSHCKFIWDVQGEVSIRYGVCQLNSQTGGIAYDPTTFVLDANLRVVDQVPLETHVPHVARVLECLDRLPLPDPNPPIVSHQAPVLTIPNVLSPEFCQYLMDLYEADGGTDSGFMQQEGDKTVLVLNHSVKRRRDLLLTDADQINQVHTLIWRRVKPEIEKAFHFRVTHFERYVVACYEASHQGFFQPHRDNRSIGTAHRRFAMTVNLNTGDYEGGCLRFPEYGSTLYRPETGSAVVFSCSLLHEATPVTVGRRFALLSFFYNEVDARLRQQNQAHVIRDAEAGSSSNPDSHPIAPHSIETPTPVSKPPRSARGFHPQPKSR